MSYDVFPAILETAVRNHRQSSLVLRIAAKRFLLRRDRVRRLYRGIKHGIKGNKPRARRSPRVVVLPTPLDVRIATPVTAVFVTATAVDALDQRFSSLPLQLHIDEPSSFLYNHFNTGRSYR